MTWKFSDHVPVRLSRSGREAQLGRSCPQLWCKDGLWNTRHGSAGFVGCAD
jgi:hypothetical protein